MPVRLLWLYDPRLSTKIVLEEMFKLRLIQEVEIGGDKILLESKMQNLIESNVCEELMINVYKRHGILDWPLYQAINIKKSLRNVRKVKIFIRSGTEKLRGVQKTCTNCHQSMDYDEDCECMLKISEQIRSKAERNSENRLQIVAKKNDKLTKEEKNTRRMG